MGGKLVVLGCLRGGHFQQRLPAHAADLGVLLLLHREVVLLQAVLIERAKIVRVRLEKLGQARGIALLVPAQFGLTVGEYAPNAVKKTVVGVGHAAKVQVDHMVRLHLPGVTIEGPDAADALAVAICHAHHLQSAGRFQAALDRAERHAGAAR